MTCLLIDKECRNKWKETEFCDSVIMSHIVSRNTSALS